MARWAQEAYGISERHAARLVKLAIGTLRYQSRKVLDEVLRHRLRALQRLRLDASAAPRRADRYSLLTK